MSAVQVFLTSSVRACRMTALLLDLLLLNQISNCSPLLPVDSVRPTSAVCGSGRSPVRAAGPRRCPRWVGTHLEGLFVDEDVEAALDLLGFAEEHKLLKEEDVALTLPPPGGDGELVLSDQPALLFQVHLGGGIPLRTCLSRSSSHTSCSTHVAVSDGVHRQQVVTVAELELDHAGGFLQR